MKKEELQKLVTELQDIYDVLSSDVTDSDQILTLIRLSNCMGKLKVQPWLYYRQIADTVLNAIQDYANNSGSLETVLSNTEFLTALLVEDLKKDSIMDTLKDGYEQAKSKITEAVPEDVKQAYTTASKQVKEVCQDTVQQANEFRKKAGRQAKSKLWDWLLSDDENER